MIPDPKEAANAASKLIHDLIKRGEAVLTVTLVPHAGDHDFSKHPPSCRVTVTVTDPNKQSVPIEAFVADIPTTSPPYTHRFTIPVRTITSRLLFWKKAPQPLNVSIVAEPINGFEETYEPDKNIARIQIRPGRTEPRNVSLKPKGKRDRPSGDVEL